MKIKRFKLNVISAENLQQKEMSAIMGGQCCGCSCYWEYQGGSSIEDNTMANYQYGYESAHGCNQFSYSDELGEAVHDVPHA